MPTPQYLQEKQAKKDKKIKDKKITAQKKFNEAKKFSINDDKPKVKKKKKVEKNYKLICYESRWLDMCDVPMCELCKVWVWTDIHHIIWWPSRKRLYSDPYNLIILCFSCHHKIHSIWPNDYDFKKELHFLVTNILKCPNTIQKNA